MERVIIVGGGVAGLSCLNALLDKGISPLLIESTTIGAPKMCGEFIAPEAVSVLQKWGMNSIPLIKQVSFFTTHKKFNLTFPKPAGAYARKEIELYLAKRAKEKGCRILENTSIQKISPATEKNPYIFYLASGEEIIAETAIFATGRFNQSDSSNAPKYFGIKIHFPYIVMPETLLMHSYQGAYFGIIPIANNLSNFACLVKREIIEKNGSAKQFFYQVVKNNKSLQQVFKHIDINNIDWLEGHAPQFGLKNIPNWPRAFWIGDAFASLPPAIGYGLTHSVNNAIMAAELYLQDNTENYQQVSRQIVKSKLRIGKLLHFLLQHPWLGFFILPLLKKNFWIVKMFLKRIGYD